MGDRRRILVAVEPRVLSDALVAMLEHVGVDDVVTFDARRGDPAPDDTFDAAVFTDPAADLHAGILIEVPTDHPEHDLHAAGAVECASPDDLLALLDRLCPADVPRTDLLGPIGPLTDGDLL